MVGRGSDGSQSDFCVPASTERMVGGIHYGTGRGERRVEPLAHVYADGVAAIPGVTSASDCDESGESEAPVVCFDVGLVGLTARDVGFVWERLQKECLG